MRWLPAILLTAFLFGCTPKAPDAVAEPPKVEQRVEAPTPTVEELLSPFFIVVSPIIEDAVYPSVGRIDSEVCHIGSGVYIGDRCVLTAAHVLYGTDAKFFSIGMKQFVIQQSIPHPDFYGWDGTMENDIGIAILEDCNPDIIPAKIATEFKMKRGDLLTTVGYSLQKKKVSRDFVFRYYGTMAEEPQFLRFLPIFISVYFGDSGGAIYNSSSELIGIISFFSSVASKPIDNAATRIDFFKDWIAGVRNEVINN